MSANKSFSSETSERYARAIFELALENSELDNVENSLKELLNIYNSSLDLESFIKNPTHSLQSQLQMVNIISKKINISKTLTNFLSTLVIKRRIFFLKKIILSFLKLSALKKGKLVAELISSKNLSQEELNNLSLELSKVIGSKINFNYKTDESLIGGFKVQVGSLLIDTSIKSRLKKYEQTMLEK